MATLGLKKWENSFGKVEKKWLSFLPFISVSNNVLYYIVLHKRGHANLTITMYHSTMSNSLLTVNKIFWNEIFFMGEKIVRVTIVFARIYFVTSYGVS